MASYKVTFKPSVEKDLAHLSRELVLRITKRIELLKARPLPRQALKLEGSEGLYRLRVGDYRIIYGIDSRVEQIVIHHIRHRREVYRGLS
ncbi:MAG: type II toxin-antitoxin system RelE/ParE family toxin [Acidobacteria bacterium]|nr:type II toxin-antitoxin system RelE/ParE family toxin [Acidobacteriota bacterium]